MTTAPDLFPRTTGTVYEEIPARPAPMLVSGPLAWMRENLFKSRFDTVLTIVTTILLVVFTLALANWVIAQANWLVITRNLRLLMVGLFPIDQVWRVNLAVLFVAFALGYSIYAYIRVSRFVQAALIGLVLTMMVVPAASALLFSTPPSFLAVGAVEVQSGTISELPQPRAAFLARQGDTVRFEIALDALNDTDLVGMSGFMDRAASGVYNAARARFRTEAEIARLDALLAGDTLTERQRAAAQDSRDGLSMPEETTATYQVNTESISIRILDGATLAQVSSAVLDIAQARDAQAGERTNSGQPIEYPVYEFVAPADGWYVLEKSLPEGSETVGILDVRGIPPILERNFTGYNEYVRITDDFTVVGGRPMFEDSQIPFISMTDNLYRGERSLPDYMSLFAGPILALLGRGLIPFIGLLAVGYGAGYALVQLRPRAPRNQSAHAPARALVGPLWAVVLTLFFVLIYGVNGYSTLDFAFMFASFAWVGWMFFAGITLNRASWGRPLFASVALTGIAQVVLLHGDTSDNVSGILLGSLVWMTIGLLAARQGYINSQRFSFRESVIGFGVSSLIWLALFLIVPLLLNAASSLGLIPALAQENVIGIVETRRWGGLLLTMVLTVVAILASFPLGVLLALGRRSSLPLVRVVCTLFIELVRGVPLITVLFMAQLLVPLINPGLANVENAIRAMVGLTLFSAAYLAENVRGGLQSVPPGQDEAARALGMGSIQITLFITLPQALRAVIPALVGQCIALFKDTSLVALVGLLDLTGMAKSITAQSEFVGTQSETYVYITVVYFIVSYFMAFISRRIEASGSGAVRRFG
ncbi:MAG: amino acid ABC transporter permease [Pleurocapsa minor GSE-CHR-MK-17-07R]|jgi:His/Glu/Gln/Arg/opine family amino acid ABC transporter permease subunit|nr:amino acid ABC transporter permease [Pleurocapsa minor GSE-CHR-MK 17-07R]